MKDNIVATGKGVFSKESNTEDRIFTDYKKMEQLVFHCRGLGLKIVLTQGSYDMVHIGHGRYLEDAKKKGDLLIVGVDSDEKVKHRKGPDRPVVPQDERLEMLTHMRSVDAVFLKELHHPKWGLIKAIKPDVLIATKETYSKAQLKELKKYCKEITVLERRATTSASAKIRNLQINTAKKLGQALTPKLIKTIEEVLAGVR